MTGAGTVHHTVCWTVHIDCARALILRQESTIATLREELATTRRQLLLVETQRLDLIRLAENHDRGPLTARTEQTP